MYLTAEIIQTLRSVGIPAALNPMVEYDDTGIRSDCSKEPTWLDHICMQAELQNLLQASTRLYICSILLFA
jgi:hypothetical protein